MRQHTVLQIYIIYYVKQDIVLAHMLGVKALKVPLMLICWWIYEKEGKRIWQRRIQLIPSAVKVLPRVRRHACNLKANARQLLSTWQCIKMTELSSRESRTQLFHQGVKFRGGHLTHGRLSQYILNYDATAGVLAVVELYSATCRCAVVELYSDTCLCAVVELYSACSRVVVELYSAE